MEHRYVDKDFLVLYQLASYLCGTQLKASGWGGEGGEGVSGLDAQGLEGVGRLNTFDLLTK